jgi:membrane-associated phospholipid phosphatase
MDVAAFWNDVVNDLNTRDHTGNPPPLDNGGPTRTSRAGALAHLALHDAYFKIVGGGNPIYMANLPNPPANASAAAAASAACYTVLKTIYKSHGAFIEEKFARAPRGTGNHPAISVSFDYGRTIGNILLDRRANDALYDERHSSRRPHVGSNSFGRHRPDPTNVNQGYLGAYWGNMPMFATQSLVQLDQPPGWLPGDLDRTNATYLDHHKEVRVLGGSASTMGVKRRPEETAIGLFWAYDGAQKIGTPPRLYNRIVQALADRYQLTEPERVRLFALVNAAMADAGIHAWYWKYRYDLWRPVIGIREIDYNYGPSAVPGINLHSEADPFWLPLGAPNTNAIGARNFTPGFPAYPSGHATFGSTAFHMSRLYLNQLGKVQLLANGGDTATFDFVSEELDGVATDADGTQRERHVRAFASLKQAIVENAVSRVYLGVHWRFDGTLGGFKMGNVTSAVYDPNPNALDLGPANSKIGGVPLGLNIAEDIFNSNLKESTKQFP